MSILPTRLNVMPREAKPSPAVQVNAPSLATPEEVNASSNDSTASADTFESNESTNSATTNKNGFWFLPTASATLGSFVGSVMLTGDEIGSFRKILAPAIGASFGVLGTLLALGKLKKKSSVPPSDSPQA